MNPSALALREGAARGFLPALILALTLWLTALPGASRPLKSVFRR